MIYEIIGWLGTGLVLWSYFLLSIQKIDSKSKIFQLMNLFGAIGIIVNSAKHRALPSVGLNIVWLLIALYGLRKALKKQSK